MKDKLEALRSLPEFHAVMREIKDHRPVVPVYDHTQDNTESWKANSNMLKGFDLVLTLLGESINE